MFSNVRFDVYYWMLRSILANTYRNSFGSKFFNIVGLIYVLQFQLSVGGLHHFII